jgi:hypothetical protein
MDKLFQGQQNAIEALLPRGEIDTHVRHVIGPLIIVYCKVVCPSPECGQANANFNALGSIFQMHKP